MLHKESLDLFGRAWLSTFVSLYALFFGLGLLFETSPASVSIRPFEPSELYVFLANSTS
jgi:hypothetical protein